MNFQIEVLSVVGPVKNQKGKNTWNVFEIAYKKDGKIEGKKLVDFNNPEVFKAVGLAKQGEVYSVTAEKINDYWQWVGFVRADGVQAAPSTPEVSAADSGGSSSKVLEKQVGRVTGSNYETPEERKLKQRYIARQSSLGYALTLLTHNAPKAVVEEAAVEALAEKFVEFVYKTDAVKGLVEMQDDIPY